MKFLFMELKCISESTNKKKKKKKTRNRRHAAHDSDVRLADCVIARIYYRAVRSRPTTSRRRRYP